MRSPPIELEGGFFWIQHNLLFSGKLMKSPDHFQ